MIETLKTMEFTPFILSFKLALITTIILFMVSLPLAWYLSQTRSKMKPSDRSDYGTAYCPSSFCVRFLHLMGIFTKTHL